MISREEAERMYDSLDDEHKRLAGILGCMQVQRFARDLLSMVTRTFSDKSDNDKSLRMKVSDVLCVNGLLKVLKK